jgi:apolipoprotein N-acyltransferase
VAEVVGTYLFGAVIAVVMAAVVAYVAEGRGQHAGVWFVVGLFIPVISLLLLLVFFRKQPLPTVDAAVVASRVAQALGDAPNSSVHALVQCTGLPEREVIDQLRALQHLGRAVRDDTGRFTLTPA